MYIYIPDKISILEISNKLCINEFNCLLKIKKMFLDEFIFDKLLNQEIAIIISSLFGYIGIVNKLFYKNFILKKKKNIEIKEDIRPPIVTVMGHVNHGKTSLLDYIRKTKIAENESGNITQYINSYNIKIKNNIITFLDTPGHEAFSLMRFRGLKIADIVVLIVAIDDGVMPQTKEIISYIKAYDLPIVVALNKYDKDDLNIEKVKQDLLFSDIISEEYGGRYPFVLISAKTGFGIDLLLENILLQAEILELKSPINIPARGVVIDVKLDKYKGIITTILVKIGILRCNDFVLIGSIYGKIKYMCNKLGNLINYATASIPVDVYGLSDICKLEDELIVVKSERIAKEISLFRHKKFFSSEFLKNEIEIKNDNKKYLNVCKNYLYILIKSDVQGICEVLNQSLLNISNSDIVIKIIYNGIGSINESDVNLAIEFKSLIIGFNVSANIHVCRLAKLNNITIKYYSVIYTLLDEVKDIINNLLLKKISDSAVGTVEVCKIFKISKFNVIAGCIVRTGIIKYSSFVRLLRNGNLVYSGKLDSLKRFKYDIKEVKSGFECGISIKNFNSFLLGDIFEVFDNKIT